MTQLALVPKPCSLLTRADYVDGMRSYWFECACGAKGERVESGPAAARLWMEHAGVRV